MGSLHSKKPNEYYSYMFYRNVTLRKELKNYISKFTKAIEELDDDKISNNYEKSYHHLVRNIYQCNIDHGKTLYKLLYKEEYKPKIPNQNIILERIISFFVDLFLIKN